MILTARNSLRTMKIIDAGSVIRFINEGIKLNGVEKGIYISVAFLIVGGWYTIYT